MAEFNLYENLSDLKDRYNNGENIINYLKSKTGFDHNTIEMIMISYDIQAGSYVDFIEKNHDLWMKFTDSIAKILDRYMPNSVLEAGIGDGTNISYVLQKMKHKPVNVYGFDIAWSRVDRANKFYEELNESPKNNFFVGDLFQMPMKDNSIDVIYTSHVLEPNGGKEKELLKEIYRVAKDYIILIEPAFEFADQKGKDAMKSKGYITELHSSIMDLGYNLIEHRLFDYATVPTNSPGLYIIKKEDSNNNIVDPLACPISLTDLKQHDDVYFSDTSLLAYPIVKGIPCLLKDKAIVATHFND